MNENSLGLGLGTTSSYGEMKVSTFKPQHQVDVSMQTKYADKSPFNIVDDSADPCKKVYHNFCKLKLGKRNLSLSLQLSPLGRRLGLLLVTKREGRASPVHVTETSGGHKMVGGGAYTL